MQVIVNPNKTIPNINEDEESEFIVNVEKDNINALTYFHIMVRYEGGSSYFVWKGGNFKIRSIIWLYAPIERSKIKVLQSTHKFHRDHFDNPQEFYIIKNMEDFLNLVRKTIPYNNEIVHEIPYELNRAISMENTFILVNIKNTKENFLYFMVPGNGVIGSYYLYTWKGGSLHDNISELNIEETSPEALMKYTYQKFHENYEVHFYSIDDMKYLQFFVRLMGV